LLRKPKYSENNTRPLLSLNCTWKKASNRLQGQIRLKCENEKNDNINGSIPTKQDYMHKTESINPITEISTGLSPVTLTIKKIGMSDMYQAGCEWKKLNFYKQIKKKPNLWKFLLKAFV
jgi:hypothetical protein